MNKYYKVIKDNFLWEVGAIIKHNNDNGYEPIDDLYKIHEDNEYISTNIIESSPTYFQRVYKVDLLTKVVYEVKEKARELIEKGFKE